MVKEVDEEHDPDLPMEDQTLLLLDYEVMKPLQKPVVEMQDMGTDYDPPPPGSEEIPTE